MQNSKTLIDKPKSVLAKNALDTGISDVYRMEKMHQKLKFLLRIEPYIPVIM